MPWRDALPRWLGGGAQQPGRIRVHVLIKGRIGEGWYDVDRTIAVPAGTTLARAARSRAAPGPAAARRDRGEPSPATHPDVERRPLSRRRARRASAAGRRLALSPRSHSGRLSGRRHAKPGSSLRVVVRRTGGGRPPPLRARPADGRLAAARHPVRSRRRRGVDGRPSTGHPRRALRLPGLRTICSSRPEARWS